LSKKTRDHQPWLGEWNLSSFLCALVESIKQSGYNTANELVILPELIPAPSCATVEYLLVLLGANDACLPSSPSKQHVSLEKYRQNLTEIITHPSVTAHSPTILLVTPPPVNEYQILAGNIASGYSEVTRRAETTAQYAQVVREIAVELKEKNVVLIDLWTALMEKALSSTPPDIVQGLNGTLLGSQLVADSQALRDLLVDGLHLTGAGYSVFLSEVSPGQYDWK
jgi:lysophospholipase L1-like esterase